MHRLCGMPALLVFAQIAQPLMISPNICSIPYLIPLSFQRHCDRSDEYFQIETKITDLHGHILSFPLPPRNVTSAAIRSKPNVWTHEPFCIEDIEANNGFCVYTNANFLGGRGISIIATPWEIGEILQATIFNDPKEAKSANNAAGAKKYIRQLVAGPKRASIVANATFERGERLQTFTPLLIVQDPVMTLMTESDKMLLLRVAVERLPVASQQLYMSLYTQPGTDPFIDRMNKNAFDSQPGRSHQPFSCAIPENARFNHECRPNTAYHFIPNTLSQEIQAVRPIAVGEEITVSYLQPYLNSTERQSQLLSQWGFHCTCPLCSSAAALSESDNRLHQIQTLIAELNVPYSNRKPDPFKVERLVELHAQEGLDGPIAVAEMYAAMEYAQMRDSAKAKIWALKAKESLRLWAGEENDYYTGMLRLLEDVEKGKWL